jgi:hypothetical protein
MRTWPDGMRLAGQMQFRFDFLLNVTQLNHAIAPTLIMFSCQFPYFCVCFLFIHLLACLFVNAFVSMYVCMFVCLYVCMFVCLIDLSFLSTYSFISISSYTSSYLLYHFSSLHHTFCPLLCLDFLNSFLRLYLSSYPTPLKRAWS